MSDGPTQTAVCQPPFESIVARAHKAFGSGRGGSLCVSHRGEIIIDTWGGWANKKQQLPWQGDTLGMTWSTTKGMAALAVHLLIARGQLGLDDRVGDHWPEYACNGKEETLIRHILAMEAGLYDIRHLIPNAELVLDWDEMCTRLASARPAHRPGEGCGYHGWTYGWLTGELVRRVTGKSLGNFLDVEVRQPLDLDGFFVGTPASEHHRVAPVPPIADLGPRVAKVGKALNLATRRLPPKMDLASFAAAFTFEQGSAVCNTPEFLSAEVPGVNGTFTARSLATVYGNLAARPDADLAFRLLPADYVATLGIDHNSWRDRVLPLQPRWRLGYFQPFPRTVTSPRSFGFFGAFGSGAWADPTRELAVGFVLAEGKSPVSPLVGIGRELIDVIG